MRIIGGESVSYTHLGVADPFRLIGLEAAGTEQA